MQESFMPYKDADMLIINMLDDESLLKLLQVNKKLLVSGQEGFKERLRRRYPEMINKKPKDVPWSQWYLNAVYYISKLKEEFDFDYIASNFDPSKIYKIFKNTYKYDLKPVKDILTFEMLIQTNDDQKIYEFLKKKPYTNEELSLLLKYKKINLFEKFYENPSGILMKGAAESGDTRIVDYILEKIKQKSKKGNLRITGKGASALGDINLYFFGRYKRSCNYRRY